MKRKIFSILFALVLVVSFSLVAAVPAAAVVTTHYVATTGSDTTGDGSASYPWATIQHAIDDTNVTDGNTISVAAGTYDEQVVIDKALTVEGAGVATIIQPLNEDILTKIETVKWISGGTKTMVAIVWADAAGKSVTIKDLKVDGVNVDAAPSEHSPVGRIAGIAYIETSGTVDTVTVVNMDTSTMQPRSVGIWSSDDTNPASTVTVQYCTVTNYNRGGIYGCGDYLTVDFNHNYITGPGVSGTQVPNGIFFLAGCVGTATYNTISACGYSGDQYRGTGIGTYDAGTSGITFGYNTIFDLNNAFAIHGTGSVIVEYNTVTASHTGVRLETDTDNNIIRYNTIQGCTYAIRASDALGNNNVANNNDFVGNTGTGYLTYDGTVSFPVGAAVTFDAKNNWWGSPTGPYNADTNPTGSGDSVGSHGTINFVPWLLVPYADVGTEGTDTHVMAQESQEFAGTDTTVDTTGATGDGTVTVTTCNYSLPPDAGASLSASAPGKQALKYINVTIISNNYSAGNICITITYTDADLARMGVSEDDLKLYYWDKDAGPAAWVEALNQSLDKPNNKLTGCVPWNKFSGIPVCLGGSEEVTGEFELGGAPEVTVTFAPTAMDPQVEQTVTVNVNVGAGRTLAELTQVKFKTWYDSDGGTTDVDEFDTKEAGNVQTCAIIIWNGTSFSIVPTGGDTTWSLGTCTAPTLTLSQGDFTLKFTPGKVATETTGSANWQLAATATSSYGTGFGYEAGSEGAAMNWYGSITLGATVNVDWGPVPADLAFGDDGLSQESLGTGITYISNGNYDKKAKSSATWEGISYTANLDSDGSCDVGQEFALKANNATTHTDAQLLDSTSVSFDATGTITSETGDVNSDNYLWLKLASTFSEDSYSGTITYSIVDR